VRAEDSTESHAIPEDRRIPLPFVVVSAGKETAIHVEIDTPDRWVCVLVCMLAAAFIEVLLELALMTLATHGPLFWCFCVVRSGETCFSTSLVRLRFTTTPKSCGGLLCSRYPAVFIAPFSPLLPRSPSNTP
jgi:hypothetical protein